MANVELMITNLVVQVTNDPQAGVRIDEPSGPVANDSLAAESTRTGGTYSENRGAEPLGVSGPQSTLNTTDTSSAKVLGSAPEGIDRKDIYAQKKYPEGLGGQGAFPGPHVPETGYVGGSTASKESMGMHANEYPASQKLSEGDDGYRSKYNAGAAPSYVSDVTENLGSTKPKGKNLREGGFDPNDPNASFTSDIGSRNDPGRGAEGAYQRSMAESGPYGSEARWEKGQDRQQPYQPLGGDQTA